MAHNSRRKEIIFMGKIRWIRACALLIMTAAIITACGRGNGNNMTTAPDTGSAGAGTTMERQTNGTNQSTNAPSQTAGESGGVLRDMVDDVGDGIHNLTDDVTGMSGTTAAGANGTHEAHAGQPVNERILYGKRYDGECVDVDKMHRHRSVSGILRK